jgi:single-strand DNA-binding protein
MSDVNIVVLQGRLTHTPELRRTGSNVSVVDIQLATNRFIPVKGQEGEYKKDTVYTRVTLWNRLAERYADPKSKSFLNKGDMVVVEGQLVDDSYEKDGVKYNGRLKVDNVSSLTLITRAAKKPAESSSTPTEPEDVPLA